MPYASNGSTSPTSTYASLDNVVGPPVTGQTYSFRGPNSQQRDWPIKLGLELEHGKKSNNVTFFQMQL